MSFFGDLAAILRPGTRRPQTTAARDGGVRVSAGLQQWLTAAFATIDSPDATSGDVRTDVAERAALERLREDPDRAVADASAAYWRTGETDFGLRWALVHCAAELRTPAATAFLADVLAAPIAAERSRDVHLFSSVGEETTQRFRALEGLRGLAADGDSRALDALNEGLRHPLHAVRVAAYQQLRELPPDRVDAADLAARLDDRDRVSVEGLRRVDVEEVGAPGEPVRVPDLPHPDEATATGRSDSPRVDPRTRTDGSDPEGPSRKGHAHG